MLGATVLTAFNDNAAITYLCTLVPSFTDGMKYAAVAGAVTGGGLTVICPIPGNLRGASWVGDTIVFATVDRVAGLERVAAAGGTPVTLTTPAIEKGELDHLWPEQLPDGRHVLFAIDKVSGGHGNHQERGKV